MRTHVLSLALAASLLGAAVLRADEDATPAAKSFPVQEVNRIGAFVSAPLDLTTIASEDRVREQLGLPPRFAIPQQVAMSPRTHGTWERLPGGKLLWRLRIIGREGASNLNLGFGRFKLPPNARLLVYSTDGRKQLRPFTAADNDVHGQLWTPVLSDRRPRRRAHRAAQRAPLRRPRAQLGEPGLPRLRHQRARQVGQLQPRRRSASTPATPGARRCERWR